MMVFANELATSRRRLLLAGMPVLRIGGYQPDASVHTRALRQFAATLRTRCGIACTVEIVPDVTRQGARAADLPAMVNTGIFDVCYLASSYLAARVEALGVLDLPFPTADRETLYRKLDGELGVRLGAEVAARSPFRVLGFWDNGFRHISNRLRPIRHPDDCGAMRLRTLDNALHREMFAALGFEPVFIDVKDLADAAARGGIDASSSDILDQLRRHSEDGSSHAGLLDQGILDSAYHYFRRTFDKTHGGFGESPKFPRPVVLNFLLRYYHRTRNPEALDMSLQTLRKMAEGGMNDQLGGGFHRYSVDERWFVPHFEKMLYDQAQLAISYLEAYQISHEPFYAAIARSVFEYVLRDLTSPEGGFYSAEDADSVIDPANPKVKGEGAFYVWNSNEIEALLDPRAAQIFCHRYGVAADGNVRNDPHGEFEGKNILYVHHSIAETARSFELSEETIEPLLATAAARLLEARSKRVRPDLDDKVLTSWNALMISAFAKGAQVLGEPRYLAAAQRSAGFILERMYNPSTGVLLRRYRDGDAAVEGFLDDYAFFIAALLDLYEADFNARRLDTAIALADKMRELFEDPQDGGFFSTATGDSSLVMRMKDDYDGAEPSGNAIALLDLLRLAHITNRAGYRDAAGKTLRSLGGRIGGQSPAVPQMLVALDYSLAPKRQVILVGGPGDDLTRGFLDKLRRRFLPDTITLLVDSDTSRAKLAEFIPAIREMKELDGRPAAYVCREYTCQLPTSDVSKFDELLQ